MFVVTILLLLALSSIRAAVARIRFGNPCLRMREPERAFLETVIEQGDIRPGRDFLTHQYDGSYDLIITNPPYSKSLEFIQRAISLRSEHGAVAMLLRLNFLCSQQRASWRMRSNTPTGLYPSPRRPDFTGGGGDATEYARFVWDDLSPRIVILGTEYRAPSELLFASEQM